ncbi:unnamed protein product [Alopecurus aequalis]
MKFQERIEIYEQGNEFDDEEKTMRVWGDFPMEKQLRDTYTLPIYTRFQLELRKITSYNARDRGGGVYDIFAIQHSVFGYGSRSYFVSYDMANGIYNCECGKFSKDGILCCHAMKVMAQVGSVHSMPAHYILARWSLPPPDIPLEPAQPKSTPATKLSRKDMKLLRYGNLCSHFANMIARLAVNSEKGVEVAEKHMKACERELSDIKKAAADALKRKKAKASTSSAVGANMPDTSTVQQDTGIPPGTVLRDPVVMPIAGRPREKRHKSGVHLRPTRPTTFSVCSETKHDVRNCPVRLANPEKYPLLALFS